jgi:hypothetical protein
MDFNRLIARRKYRVHLKPSKLFKKLEKFLCTDELFPSCTTWLVEEKEKGFIEFAINMEWQWLIERLQPPIEDAALEKLEKEFAKDVFGCCDETLGKLRDDLPIYLHVMILEKDESMCICQVECRSALYKKLSKKFVNLEDVTDFQFINSFNESLVFLDKLFIGVLEGKPIQDSIEKLPDVELLINNSQQRQITDKISSLLRKATSEILICGWIGTHFLPTLNELADEGITVRFITHQPSEAKNQPWRSEINEAFEKLCSKIGKENVCTDPKIHGRMIIIDNKALVGSMDLNSSSLTGPHTEFAIYTERPEIIRSLRKTFYSKFKPLKSK